MADIDSIYCRESPSPRVYTKDNYGSGFFCHLSDFLVDIGAVMYTVPVFVAHAPEKTAGRAFQPYFVLVGELCRKCLLIALGTDEWFVHGDIRSDEDL